MAQGANTGKTTLYCGVCGRPFEVQPSRAPGRKLCGARECRAEAKRRQLAALRDAPGARAKAAATRKAQRAARLGTRPDGTVDAACCVCGAVFATRLRPAPGRTRRTCSRTCLNQLLGRLKLEARAGGKQGGAPDASTAVAAPRGSAGSSG